MYLGIEGRYDDLPHHTIYMRRTTTPRNLGDIENRHVLSDDPSFYVQNACVTDPSARAGGDEHAVRPRPGHAPARERRLGEGSARVPREAPASSSRRSGYQDVEKRIRFEKVVTPADWEHAVPRSTAGRRSTWRTTCGQMLHLRPRNRFEELDGVYLVGGGTHPGSGLPVIYESARITSRLLLGDLGCDADWLGTPGAVEPAGAVTRARRRRVWMSRDRKGAARLSAPFRSRLDCQHLTQWELQVHTTAERNRVGVIGGGLGGLAAACTLAARGLRGHAVREERLARRQGGRARSGRLPLRHGADDPHHPVGAAAHLRRGRPASSKTTSTWSGSTRSGGASSPTAPRSTWSKTRTRWPRRSTLRARIRPTGTASSSRCRSGCTSISDATSSGSRSAASRDMIDLKAGFSAEAARRRAGDADGPVGRRHGAEVRPGRRASRRCSTTSRSTSARRPELAGGAVRHRPHADAARASGTRRAAPGPCPRRWSSLADELGVEFRTELRRPAHPDRRHGKRVSRRRDRQRRA